MASQSDMLEQMKKLQADYERDMAERKAQEEADKKTRDETFRKMMAAFQTAQGGVGGAGASADADEGTQGGAGGAAFEAAGAASGAAPAGASAGADEGTQGKERVEDGAKEGCDGKTPAGDDATVARHDKRHDKDRGKALAGDDVPDKRKGDVACDVGADKRKEGDLGKGKGKGDKRKKEADGASADAVGVLRPPLKADDVALAFVLGYGEDDDADENGYYGVVGGKGGGEAEEASDDSSGDEHDDEGGSAAGSRTGGAAGNATARAVTFVASFAPVDASGNWTCPEKETVGGVERVCGKFVGPGRQQGAGITNHMNKVHLKFVQKDETKKRDRKKKPTATPSISSGALGVRDAREGGASSGALGGSVARRVEVAALSSDDDEELSLEEQLKAEKKKSRALQRALEAAEAAAEANLGVAVKCAKKLLAMAGLAVPEKKRKAPAGLVRKLGLDGKVACGYVTDMHACV